nr:hypothetical protein StreXyl84_29980 [Streptomyces sp. Xyl84]
MPHSAAVPHSTTAPYSRQADHPRTGIRTPVGEDVRQHLAHAGHAGRRRPHRLDGGIGQAERVRRRGGRLGDARPHTVALSRIIEPAGIPCPGPRAEIAWRTPATTATFPEAVRENEEVVPVNAVSTWVLSSGVTVGR